MTKALGSSGTMSMAMSSLFVCLFVCVSTRFLKKVFKAQNWHLALGISTY